MVKLMRHANENEVVQVVQSLGLHRINKQYIIRQSTGYTYIYKYMTEGSTGTHVLANEKLKLYNIFKNQLKQSVEFSPYLIICCHRVESRL